MFLRRKFTLKDFKILYVKYFFIPMEMTTAVKEDPLEELAESNWPVKAGYKWVACSGGRDC